MGKSGKLFKTLVAGIKTLKSPSKENREKEKSTAHPGKGDNYQQRKKSKDRCLWRLGRSTSRKRDSLTAIAAYLDAPETKSVHGENSRTKDAKFSSPSETVGLVKCVDKSENEPLSGFGPMELQSGPFSHMESCDPEDWAATSIQAAFRGYLARRAFRALQALVKLQAIARGWIVRKHASTSLRCMQALVKVQAHVRGHHVRMSELGQLVQKHLQQIKLQKRKPTEGWVSSIATVQQLQAKAQSKQEAVMKRQRALVYTYSEQLHKSSTKASPLSLVDYEPDISHWAWIWLERWTAAHPWGNVAREQPNREEKPNSKGDTEKSNGKCEVFPITVAESISSLQSRHTSSSKSIHGDILHLHENSEPEKENERHKSVGQEEEQLKSVMDLERATTNNEITSADVVVANALVNTFAVQGLLAPPEPPPSPPPSKVQRFLPSPPAPPVVQGLISTPAPPSPQVSAESGHITVDDVLLDAKLVQTFGPSPAASISPTHPPPVTTKLPRSSSPPAPPPLPPPVRRKHSSPALAPCPPPPPPPLGKKVNPLVAGQTTLRNCQSLGHLNLCSATSVSLTLDDQTSSTAELVPTPSSITPVSELSLPNIPQASFTDSSDNFTTQEAQESCLKPLAISMENVAVMHSPVTTKEAQESCFKPLAISMENIAVMHLPVAQETPHVEVPTEPILSNAFSSASTFVTDMHSPSQAAPCPPSVSNFAPDFCSPTERVLDSKVEDVGRSIRVDEVEKAVDMGNTGCINFIKDDSDMGNTGCINFTNDDSDEVEKAMDMENIECSDLKDDAPLQAAPALTNGRCSLSDVSNGHKSAAISPNKLAAISPNKLVASPASRHDQLAETASPSIPNYMTKTKSSMAKMRTLASPKQKTDSPKLRVESPKQKLDVPKQKLQELPKKKHDFPKQKSVSPKQKLASAAKRRQSLPAMEGKSSPESQKPTGQARAGSKAARLRSSRSCASMEISPGSNSESDKHGKVVHSITFI